MSRRHKPPSPASPTATSPPTASPVDAFPYGTSLFPSIVANDRSSALCQTLILTLGILLLALVPLSPVLSIEAGADGGWDAAHGVAWGDPLRVLGALLEDGVGVGPDQVRVLAWVTAGAFGLLFVVDAAGRLLGGTRGPLIDWPRSWDTANTLCYDDMFCEPTRALSLVRRPGNVYSNALYLFGGLVVLAGCFTGSLAHHTFWVADAMFGAMLVILAVLSVVWHSSNSPTSQYLDLWSMDSCIAFLIVRFVALAAASHKSSPVARWFGVKDAAVASWGCVVLFGGVVVKNGTLQYASFTQRRLHGSCPFSGRRKLHNNAQLGVTRICAFACLPFYYMILPCVVQVCALGTVGSVVAMTSASACLVIGWSMRMTERFCLDGNAAMNAIRAAQASATRSGAGVPSWLAEPALTAAAAFASPTAALHLFTSLTLVLGYCHVRTVDAEVLA